LDSRAEGYIIWNDLYDYFYEVEKEELNEEAGVEYENV
jgi:hypothetical protein